MNLDETECFWQALPNCGFNQNSGGKKSKYRITIAFIVSAVGKKEKSGKYGRRRYFKRFDKKFDKSLFPVSYYSHTTQEALFRR